MKCQRLFSRKNKKNVINLSSAEFAKRVVKVKNFKSPQTINIDETRKMYKYIYPK